MDASRAGFRTREPGQVLLCDRSNPARQPSAGAGCGVLARPPVGWSAGATNRSKFANPFAENSVYGAFRYKLQVRLASCAPHRWSRSLADGTVRAEAYVSRGTRIGKLRGAQGSMPDPWRHSGERKYMKGRNTSVRNIAGAGT